MVEPGTTSPRTANALPLNVYELVVKSLYGDFRTLVVGAAATVISPLILFWRTGDPAHMWFAMLLSTISLMRIVDGQLFARATRIALSRAQLQKWENRYAFLGAVNVFLLGAWCFVGYARTSDEFVHMMSVFITISYIIGIMGRNFSSEKVVFSQTVMTGVPIISGFVLFGDIYNIILGAFLFPLFLTIWLMSRKLRFILLDSVVSANDYRITAQRFDIALSNVSLGMAMLDGTGAFTVVNRQFAQLFGLEEGSLATGDTIEKLGNSEAEFEPEGRKLKLAKILQRCLANGKWIRFTTQLGDGRTIEATYNPMQPDGGVVVLQDVTERTKAENEIRQLANFDALTHLPNRRFFASEISRRMGNGDLAACTFFFIDLDNFKDINDTLGHATGDKLLVSVTRQLRNVVPDAAIACRFGGDEFVLVVGGVLTRERCSRMAQALIEELSKPVLIEGQQLAIGASIGISQCPQNGSDYHELLKASDAALYDAKNRGRGCFSYYSDELGDMIRGRREMEVDLRYAVERGELEIYYQPLVNLQQNRITTCEALLRWNHPKRGIISPSLFIPIAEQIGAISSIGRYVLEEATRQCATWPRGTSVAVNVSSLQFQRSDVNSVVAAALAKSGLHPSRLEIEVTESAMLENMAETKATLLRLSKTGVRISLDDFGTGFSSLANLHALPLDKIKIDRTFIENIETDSRSMILLQGVTHMAAKLGLSIVIEGVETTEQLDMLREAVHLDEIQGYLFGRAMPGQDIAILLEKAAGAATPREQKAAG